MVRFKSGRPEKRGGWARAFVTATSGQPRALRAWRDNNSNSFMGAGTYRKLYVYDFSGVQNDITPYRLTGTEANNPFTTTNGSTSVSVAHNAHGVIEGDTVVWAGASTFNNVTMNGTFIVLTVTNANAFVVTANTTANASGSGGGAAVTYSYEINIGVELGAYGLGWGVGGWGLGTWGSAHASSTIFIEPRIWSLDNFGQILLAAYNGGSLYKWNPSTDYNPLLRSTIVATAPTDFRAMFITPERFVIALRDQMVLHGSSQGDFTIWTPSSSNTAFTRTLQEGSKLVSGRVLGPFLSLVWSDGALYLMQYTGSQFVYNVSLAGKDCGLIAPGAAVTVDGKAYWQGQESFWMYDGSVRKMPHVEDIRDYVFETLKAEAAFQCHAVYNTRDDEIEFFYTVIGDTNPMHSVIYGIKDQCWSTHTWGATTLGRVSGTHYTQGDTRPYLGATDGKIYQHENTNNGDGVAIAWTISMGPIALHEGLMNMRVDGILFDFAQQAGDITVLAEAWDRLNDASPIDSETEVTTTISGLIDYDICGRYIGLTYSSNVLNSFMRLGKTTVFMKPKGTAR
jgi:hypothetical protein